MSQYWDPNHKNANMTLSGSNLVATNAGSSYTPAFAALGVNSGKFYWEFSINVGSGSAGVGLGITTSTTTTGQWIGIETGSIGWNSNGGVWNGGAQVATWATYSLSTLLTVCFALDRINNKIWGRVGTAGNWNNAVIGSQNPATNTGGLALPAGVTSGLAVPAINGFATGDVFTAKFTRASWGGTPPAGFDAFDSLDALIVETQIAQMRKIQIWS